MEKGTPKEVERLLRMLGRPYAEDVVFNRAMLDRFPKKLRPEALTALRSGFDVTGSGRHGRVLYAIVRLAGTEAPELREVFVNPKARKNIKYALFALTDDLFVEGPVARPAHSRFGDLPEWLLPYLEDELRREATPELARALASAISAIPSARSVELLLDKLDDGDYRKAIADAWAMGCPAARVLVDLPQKARDRFEWAATQLQTLGPTRPHPKALAIAQAIVGLRRRDAGLARSALRFADRLGHMASFDPLFHQSATLMAPGDLERLAELLGSGRPEQWRLGIIGFEALPLERKAALLESWIERDGMTTGVRDRWRLIARHTDSLARTKRGRLPELLKRVHL